jgi:ABC-type glycerol-3-phosphate transport system permease component
VSTAAGVSRTTTALARTTRRFRRRSWLLLALPLLLVLSAIVLLPIGWMLTVALKPDTAPVISVPPQWFPNKYFEFENFVRTLTNPLRPFGRYVINTGIIFLGNIIGLLLSCSLTGYAFARMRFRYRDQLFWLLIVTMLIPWQALVVPQFLLFRTAGWYGTYLPLIVPAFFGNAFYIFLIRQYMRSIPRELDEAARIDGAGHLRIFWSIILPLSKPALAVVAVFAFLGSWNDLLGPLIYLNKNDQFTVALGLANSVTRANTDWNLVMAANLLMMIPPIVIYFVLQRQLVGGIASVGIKG